MAKNSRRRSNKRRTKQVRCQTAQTISIEILSDDVLLEIFGFCVDQGQYSKEEMKSWQLLIHVCRRWRTIILGSPRSLNLRLFCTPQTSPGDTLGIWPDLPFLIRGSISSKLDVVNAITMLNYGDRIRIIDFGISNSDLNYVSAAMQKPFPELTHLLLDASYSVPEPVLADSFLGGSAPHLRVLSLSGVTFPGLPRFLLSATHLVSFYLNLNKISNRLKIRPEAIATALPALIRLEILEIEFHQYQASSNADGQRPPLTRSVLPALTRFTFRGKGEDFNTLVAQLDTPLLNRLSVTFFNPVNIEIPTKLANFIDQAPMFRANDEANIVFSNSTVTVKLTSQAIGHECPLVSIQSITVPNLAHFCTPSFSPLSTFERLCIYEIGHVNDRWGRVIGNTHWLHPFIAVKNLYVSQLFAPQIVCNLQELVGRGMIFPVLQNIFIERLQLSRPIQQLFDSARQLSGRSINAFHWDIQRPGAGQHPEGR